MFVLGLVIGAFIGTGIMCIMQINRIYELTADCERWKAEAIELEKSDADKERYTIELYNRARKAEEKADSDYWEREAKKWCSKLGEIRGLMERNGVNV